VSDTVELTELTDTDPMLREINRGLMIRWINADLTARAHYDVRTSTVLYDADKLFAGALPFPINDELREMLGETAVRFYSTGIV
jgi:hypothetical protein